MGVSRQYLSVLLSELETSELKLEREKSNGKFAPWLFRFAAFDDGEQTHDLVTLFLDERRGDGRVHTAGHGDKYALRIQDFGFRIQCSSRASLAVGSVVLSGCLDDGHECCNDGVAFVQYWHY